METDLNRNEDHQTTDDGRSTTAASKSQPMHSGTGSAVPALPGEAKFFKIFEPLSMQGEKMPPGTILSEVVDILRMNGICNAHIIPCLMIIIGAISSRCGESLITFITSDEESQTNKIVQACMQLIPENTIMDIVSFDPKVLASLGHGLKCKTLVVHGGKSFKRNISLLQPFFEKQYVAGIAGPVSIVATVNKHNADLINLPYVLRPHLVSSKEIKKHQMLYQAARLSPEEKMKLILRTAPLVKMLGRIPDDSQVEVEIPFDKQIVDALDLGIPGVYEIFQNMLRMIRIMARVNSVTGFNEREKDFEYFKIDPRIFSTAGSGKAQVIIATKAVYYYVYILFKEMLPKGPDAFPEPQLRVFKAAYKLNFDKLKSTCMFDPDEENDSLKLLKQLHSGHNIGSWVDRETIYEEINNGREDKISLSELDEYLKQLVEAEFIKQKKSPQNKDKYLYGVYKLKADESMKLPEPSSIIDPVYNGDLVEVINPLTREIEKI
ncbi:MAG: hypothetical protein WCQ99_00400 [Pseudomonadota bacterium]